MRIRSLFFLALFISNTAVAVSWDIDCVRPIKSIRTAAMDYTLYVIHGDGYANSGMQLTNVENDNEVINRTLSLLLTAHISGKVAIFRYVDTNGAEATCTPSATQQFIGAFIE